MKLRHAVSFYYRPKKKRGVTLIELMVVLAAVAILLAIAVPTYQGVMDKRDMSKTIKDLNTISTALDQMYFSQNRYPESLSEIGLDGMKDPWGRAYSYVNLTNPANSTLARKDRFLHPVNNDFDLYSVGKDGETATNFNNTKSEDDVIRANSGGYFGLVVDY